MRRQAFFFTSADSELWRLALPMILSNITVPLLGLVDTAVIAHLDSYIYPAGVAVGTTATSFIVMMLTFLRMGTTGLTAQACGAGDSPAIMRHLLQPLIMAALIGALLIVLRTPLSLCATLLVGGSDQVLAQAMLFMRIRWLSAPAILINMVLTGWFLGIQRVRETVIMLVAGNVLNIGLVWWLVSRWKVEGAATATVLSEYFVLLLGLALAYRVIKQQGIPIYLLKRAWRGDVRQLLALNRDIMLRSFILQICFAAVTVFGAKIGPQTIALNAILLMYLTFTAYALDGFAWAVEVHSGRAFGGGSAHRLLAVYRAACRQAGLVALGFSLFYWFAGRWLFALLTSLPELRDLATHYLFWQSLLPLAGVGCYLLDGIFIGAARGREMRNGMLLAALGFGLTLLLLPCWGNHAIWLALTLFLLLRGLVLWLYWRAHWRNKTWFSV